MKELYLAKDPNGKVYGFDKLPVFNTNVNEWRPKSTKDWWYNPEKLAEMNIDVTKFPLTHETPIKIRAVWEVINE